MKISNLGNINKHFNFYDISEFIEDMAQDSKELSRIECYLDLENKIFYDYTIRLEITDAN